MYSKLKLYFNLMRFNKPEGTLLLLWPTLWSLWLATHNHPSLKLFLIFFFGVIVMRAAGCIINDMADRNIDKEVARTQFRPLASGKVRFSEALILLLFLLLMALFLVLHLNEFSIQLSLVALFLTGIYPFTKRFFSAPQLVLGLTFNFGILMAYAATQGHIPFAGWWLYLSCIPWIIAYDTCYALEDKEDDLKLGVHSTAILFGQYDLLIIFVLQSLFLIMLFILGGFLNLSAWFFVALLAVLAIFIYQQKLIRLRQKGNGLKAFKMNHWVGLLIFLGIVESLMGSSF
jgi:4-hydroxybenzoate polyprenyltransferase